MSERVIRRWIGGLLLAVFAWGAVAQAAAPKPENGKLIIAVGGQNQLCYLPLLIAGSRGYFSAEGLPVEIVDYAGNTRPLQAMLTATADAVAGPYELTLSQQAKNLHLRAIVVLAQTPQLVLAVSNTRLPNYQSVADLKGKRIGIVAPGTPSAMMATYILASAGLTPNDVFLIGVGASTTAVTAMRSGQIDALFGYDPAITELETSGTARVVLDARTPAGTAALFGGPVPSSVLYVSETFIRNNPNTTQALADALVRALKWLQTATPDEVVQSLPETNRPRNPALYKQALRALKESWSPEGLMDPQAPEVVLQLLRATDPALGNTPLDPGRTYTNTFAEHTRQSGPN